MGIGSTESRRALLALTTLAAVTLLVGRDPNAARSPLFFFLLLLGACWRLAVVLVVGGARQAQRPGGAVAVTTQKPVFVLTGQKYEQHQKNQRVEISLCRVFVSTLDLLPI